MGAKIGRSAQAQAPSQQAREDDALGTSTATVLRQCSSTAAGLRSQAAVTASGRGAAGQGNGEEAEEDLRSELEQLRAETAELEQLRAEREELRRLRAEVAASKGDTAGAQHGHGQQQMHIGVMGLFESLLNPKEASKEVGVKELALLVFVVGFLVYLVFFVRAEEPQVVFE